MSRQTSVVDYVGLKIKIRQSGLAGTRERTWPILPQINRTSSSGPQEYNDVLASSERLAKMLPSRISDSGSLSPDERHLMLLCSLSEAKGEDCLIFIDAFLRVIAETISHNEVCQFIAWDLFDNPGRRLVTDVKSHRLLVHAFKKVLHGYMPHTTRALQGLGALDEVFLNVMFLGWFRTVLPYNSVLRLFDAFLLEGEKVIIRYAVALLSGYKRNIKRGVYATGADFWATVQRDKQSNGDQGTVFLAETIHSVAFDGDRSRLQKVRRPLSVSRMHLADLKKQAQEDLGAGAYAPLLPPYFSPLLPAQPAVGRYGDLVWGGAGSSLRGAPRSVFPLRTTSSRVDGPSSAPPAATAVATATAAAAATADVVHARSLVSEAMSFKVSAASKVSADSTPTAVDTTMSPSMYSVRRQRASTPQSLASKSMILCDRKAAKLLHLFESAGCHGGGSGVPAASLDAQPKVGEPKHGPRRLPDGELRLEMVFSSTIHGFMLSTLYAQTRGMSDLVILVKSLSSSESVVGGYLDGVMRPPSIATRGTSRSFIFELTDNDARTAVGYYPEESGNSSSGGTSGGSNSSVFVEDASCPPPESLSSDDTEKQAEWNRRLQSTRTQYAVCAPEYLSFGASMAHASNAIRIDADLRVCSCGPSDTYGNANSIVVATEPNSLKREESPDRTRIFHIEEVEAYRLISM